MAQDIYLGIDGVILTKGVTPALHLNIFLENIVRRFNVSWLSSRCRGSREIVEKYLSQFLEPSTIALTRAIKPTMFDLEKNILKKHNTFSSWIELDLIKSPNQLEDLTNSKLLFSK